MNTHIWKLCCALAVWYCWICFSLFFSFSVWKNHKFAIVFSQFVLNGQQPTESHSNDDRSLNPLMLAKLNVCPRLNKNNCCHSRVTTSHFDNDANNLRLWEQNNQPTCLRYYPKMFDIATVGSSFWSRKWTEEKTNSNFHWNRLSTESHFY